MDDLTFAESTFISRLGTISGVEPDLLPVLLDLEWTKDWISENDKLEIGLLALLDQPTSGIVATVPWFITAPVKDQDINLLKAIARLFAIFPELSVQVAGMDFFRDSEERHDVSSVDAIKTLSQDPEDWALLTKQSWYKDGITDDEAVVLTVLPGQAKSVPADHQSLVDNRFYIEKSLGRCQSQN